MEMDVTQRYTQIYEWIEELADELKIKLSEEDVMSLSLQTLIELKSED